MFDINFVLLAWTFCMLLAILASFGRFWFMSSFYVFFRWLIYITDRGATRRWGVGVYIRKFS